MFSDQNQLDDKQISEIVKQLIKRTKGNIKIDKHNSFYNNLQIIASELGYIEKPKYNQSILSYNDAIKWLKKYGSM